MKTENTIPSMIGDIGTLLAGCQTVKNGKTLREIKPEKYAPQSDFGKWLEGTVNYAIKSSKLKELRSEYDAMADTLHKNKHLIPEAQNEVEMAFIQNFGAEKMQSNEWLDKVMRNMKIAKLCVIAKQAGVNEIEVDRVKNLALSNFLKSHSLL